MKTLVRTNNNEKGVLLSVIYHPTTTKNLNLTIAKQRKQFLKEFAAYKAWLEEIAIAKGKPFVIVGDFNFSTSVEIKAKNKMLQELNLGSHIRENMVTHIKGKALDLVLEANNARRVWRVEVDRTPDPIDGSRPRLKSDHYPIKFKYILG